MESAPILNHWKKVIWLPERFSSMPSATMLAVLPIMVILPPKQAPKSRAHQRGRSLMLPESCSITGQKAATKITLSMKAEPMAETTKMNGTRIPAELPHAPVK